MAAREIVRHLGIADWVLGWNDLCRFNDPKYHPEYPGGRRQSADIAIESREARMATMEFTSINVSVVIDSFLATAHRHRRHSAFETVSWVKSMYWFASRARPTASTASARQ